MSTNDFRQLAAARRVCHIRALVARWLGVYRCAMDTVLPSPGAAFGLGEALSALLRPLTFRLRPDSVVQEDEVVPAAIRSASEEFGAYVLEAEDWADMLARADTLLEDPGYYQRFYGLMDNSPERREGLAKAAPTTPPPNFLVSKFAEPLGPAAVPYLRELERSLWLQVQWTTWVVSNVPEMFAAGMRVMTGMEADGPLPLDLLGQVPIPMARSILGSLRSDVFMLGAFDLVVRPRRTDPWVGRAVAELWAQEAREQLVMVASFEKIAIPFDLVPPEKRFDVQALDRAFERAEQAYKQFTTDAELSGEPVYPSAT